MLNEERELPLRVLLADDCYDTQFLVRRGLEGMNIELDTVKDGIQALELFREDPSYYDVYVLDQDMPGLHGNQVLAVMRDLGFYGPAFIHSDKDRSSLALEVRGVFIWKHPTGRTLREALESLAV